VWTLPLARETSPFTDSIEIPDAIQSPAPLTPDETIQYPWANDQRCIVWLHSRTCPTAMNPTVLSVTFRGAAFGFFRYHLVPSTDLTEAHSTLLAIQPVSVGRLPGGRIFVGEADQFGGGICYYIRPTSRGSGKHDVYVYRGLPYGLYDPHFQETNRPRPFSRVTDEVRDAIRLPLKAPNAFGIPLACCTLSGRIVYSNARGRNCVDYLP
jgi:hypothetical protein